MLCGVVRHAERADADFGEVDGEFWVGSDDQRAWPFDPPLSDEGVQHAHRLAERIRDFAEAHESRFDVVVTSPYKRCVQTALIITAALEPGTKVLVDRSLGEVFNEECIRCVDKPRNLVRPLEGWQASWSPEVDCMYQAMGTWPAWGETAAQARLRYAQCFLSYLRRGADSWKNFLLVTHSNGVAASLSMMPFAQKKVISSVQCGGLFVAKSQHTEIGRYSHTVKHFTPSPTMMKSLSASVFEEPFDVKARQLTYSQRNTTAWTSEGATAPWTSEGATTTAWASEGETTPVASEECCSPVLRHFSAQGDPSCVELDEPEIRASRSAQTPRGAAGSWEFQTYNIKFQKATGKTNRLLMKVAERIHDTSMTIADMEALLTAGMRASLLRDNYEKDDAEDTSGLGSGELDSSCIKSSLRYFSEVTALVSQVKRQDSPASQDSMSSTGVPSDQSTDSGAAILTTHSPFESQRLANLISASQRPANLTSMMPLPDIRVVSMKLLQSLWRSEASIVFCDGRVGGCPIYHAKDGFLQLFELTSDEVVGRRCGDIVAPDPMLHSLSWTSQVHVARAVRTMLKTEAHADTAASVVLLNRKKSGALFVNLLVMRTHQSQMTRVPYIIGMQQDITHDVPVPLFLQCCRSPKHYEALMRTQERALAQRVDHLSLDCDDILFEILNMTQASLNIDL